MLNSSELQNYFSCKIIFHRAQQGIKPISMEVQKINEG